MSTEVVKKRRRKAARKVLKFDQQAVIKHMKVLTNHAIVEQGGEYAVRVLKEMAYWQKGNERIPLSDEEAGKLIFH